MDNISESNITIDIDKLNNEKILDNLFILIFYILLLFIGIIGNIFVLIVYKHKLKRSSARAYIISLAFADLFVCTVGIPYTTLDKVWLLTYTKASVCKTLTFFLSAGSFCSVFVLLVVGLDRYLKVCRPLKRQIRDFGNRKACIIAVILGIIIGLPIIELYGTASYPVEPGIIEHNCYVDDKYSGSMFATIYLSLYILIFVISVLYLVIMYGFICKKIYEHDKMEGEIVLKKKRGCCGCVQDDNDDNDEELDEDIDNTNDKDIELQTLRQNEAGATQSDADNTNKESVRSSASERKKLKSQSSGGMIRHKVGKKQQKATRKITLMMFTITVVFIVAYLPFLMISILGETVEGYWEDMEYYEELIHDFLLRFYLVNNVANPVIYCFWDKRFRKECVRMLKRYLCCSKEDDTTPKNSSSSSGVSRDTTMYSVTAKQ